MSWIFPTDLKRIIHHYLVEVLEILFSALYISYINSSRIWHKLYHTLNYFQQLYFKIVMPIPYWKYQFLNWKKDWAGWAFPQILLCGFSLIFTFKTIEKNQCCGVFSLNIVVDFKNCQTNFSCWCWLKYIFGVNLIRVVSSLDTQANICLNGIFI